MLALLPDACARHLCYLTVGYGNLLVNLLQGLYIPGRHRSMRTAGQLLCLSLVKCGACPKAAL